MALAILKVKSQRIYNAKQEDSLFIVLLKYPEFETLDTDVFI